MCCECSWGPGLAELLGATRIVTETDSEMLMLALNKRQCDSFVVATETDSEMLMLALN
jgi:hypothetical protein